MERKRAQRMTDVPQLGPEVFFDDSHSRDIARPAPPPVSPFSPFLAPWEPEPDFSHAREFTGRRRRETETSIVATPMEYVGAGFPAGPSRAPSQRPAQGQSHKATQSAYSFDTGELNDTIEGTGHRRGGSTAQNVLEVLDNSAWGASIRRSFTLRRPNADGSFSSHCRT